MLIKNIKGRLGNQMFQYATIKSFQKKLNNGTEIGFCFKLVEKKAKKENFKDTDSLKYFKTEYQKLSRIKLNSVQRILIFLISTILFFYKYIVRNNYEKNRDKVEEKFKNLLLKNNIIWKTIGYTDFDLDKIKKEKNIFFYGYFESPKYFNSIKNQLKKDFFPKEELLNKNRELFEIINQTNSVCVSIRRGDFVFNEKYSKEHYICNEEYFTNAIEMMNKKINNPRYIIFSDDIEWVKSNMKFPDKTLFESGDDPVWEKLRIMSHCKHFIISNSSFSWWAQYLALNKNKVVIAPKKWNKKNDNRDMYEDTWILL